MKNRKVVYIIMIIILSLTSCFLLSEILTRFYVPSLIKRDERNILYQYDSELGWAPIPCLTSSFEGSRKINVTNNQYGFRDINHGEKLKRRIAFLGD